MREEFGEDADRDRPEANDNEDNTTPALHTWCFSAQPGDEFVLRCPDRQCQAEDQQDDYETSDTEGSERGEQTADRQRVPDQTGQDRASSAKARQDVDEPEQAEAERRVFTAQASLTAHHRRRDNVRGIKRTADDAKLNQPEQDQQ